MEHDITTAWSGYARSARPASVLTDLEEALPTLVLERKGQGASMARAEVPGRVGQARATERIAEEASYSQSRNDRSLVRPQPPSSRRLPYLDKGPQHSRSPVCANRMAGLGALRRTLRPRSSTGEAACPFNSDSDEKGAGPDVNPSSRGGEKRGQASRACHGGSSPSLITRPPPAHGPPDSLPRRWACMSLWRAGTASFQAPPRWLPQLPSLHCALVVGGGEGLAHEL